MSEMAGQPGVAWSEVAGAGNEASRLCELGIKGQECSQESDFPLFPIVPAWVPSSRDGITHIPGGFPS